MATEPEGHSTETTAGLTVAADEPMPQVIAEALALARSAGPDTDGDALMSAAGDLAAWGALDEASKVVGLLEERGLFPAECARLRKAFAHFQTRGPEFEERFLVNAIAIARDPAATTDSLISAADSLLRWGALEEADLAIERLRQNPATAPQAAGLAAASRQLRRSGVLTAFSAVGYPETRMLNRPYEALTARGSETADKVVIVFTGAERKFWMSLHLLYHFLRKFDAHVVYLNDHSATMFLNGLASIDGGYPGLVGKLREIVDGLKVKKVYVMAASAGGYVGLRAAVDLKADGYLGFGVRTTLVEKGPIMLARYEKQAVSRCTDPTMVADLLPYIQAHGWPRAISLYTADGVRSDRAQAEHVKGLANAKIYYVENFRAHNVLPVLIARGEFETALRLFLQPEARDG